MPKLYTSPRDVGKQRSPLGRRSSLNVKERGNGKQRFLNANGPQRDGNEAAKAGQTLTSAARKSVGTMRKIFTRPTVCRRSAGKTGLLFTRSDAVVLLVHHSPFGGASKEKASAHQVRTKATWTVGVELATTRERCKRPDKQVLHVDSIQRRRVGDDGRLMTILATPWGFDVAAKWPTEITSTW
uniref:Uncharacterized protein n=1 Tax=Trichuris muris TaxID=70415 RepID=A0A5S6Q787_TRIMR